MAAEFGLVGLSSSGPFGGFNNGGNLNMMPLPGLFRTVRQPTRVAFLWNLVGQPYVMSKGHAVSTIYHQEMVISGGS